MNDIGIIIIESKTLYTCHWIRDGSMKLSTAPMIDPDAYEFKYLKTGKIISKEYFMNT